MRHEGMEYFTKVCTTLCVIDNVSSQNMGMVTQQLTANSLTEVEIIVTSSVA